MEPEFIAKRITELRLSRNISEYQLSLELGLSRSYIQGITSGKNMPSVKQLFNIADYFGITLAEFFSVDDDGEAITPAQLDVINLVRVLNDDDCKLLQDVICRFIVTPAE